MSDYQHLKITTTDRVGILTLDRPPVNALSIPLLHELDRALDELLAAGVVKALVITGAGSKAFAAGADISYFDAIIAMEADARQQAADDYIKLGQDVFLKLDRLPIPTIAAINGVSLGGGMELALACDIRYAAENARLGLPEINLGIMPGWGGTQRMAQIVGTSRALELILTGEPILAAQALEIGLVSRVLPAGELLTAAAELAAKIASKSRVAVQAALHAVTAANAPTIDAGMELERAQFQTMSLTADMREGISAFLAKRAPQFTDA